MSAVTIVDTSMRDGMNSMSHRFTTAQVAEIAAGLDAAGVRLLEVGHGDGIGGSSIQFGFATARDAEYVAAAAGAVERTKVAVLYVPGVGTLRELDQTIAAGIGAVRIATHCTEADCAQQAIVYARERGLQVLSFLMMSHKLEPEQLVEQAALLEGYGSQVIYVVDSAGALLPDGAAARVGALREALSCEVGFHAHNNLGCAIGNSLAALGAGATYVDGSLRGLGAGAGNAQTEVLAAAVERAGYETGIDLWKVLDVAEDVITPLLPRPQIIDEIALTIGYAGVYSTFALFAERAAEKYGVDVRDVLVELGRRGAIGGQEDMIIDVAEELSRRGSAVTG
ncbi:MAG TPA: 4-hydroxy-2-oxovalerate aldolase [Solirubrobacterales bacterium]|nr:4-hydroxy-2-oxovalerate aldolase [Solirubrobacterales bacterium]